MEIKWKWKNDRRSERNLYEWVFHSECDTQQPYSQSSLSKQLNSNLLILKDECSTQGTRLHNKTNRSLPSLKVNNDDDDDDDELYSCVDVFSWR